MGDSNLIATIMRWKKLEPYSNESLFGFQTKTPSVTDMWYSLYLWYRSHWTHLGMRSVCFQLLATRLLCGTSRIFVIDIWTGRLFTNYSHSQSVSRIEKERTSGWIFSELFEYVHLPLFAYPWRWFQCKSSCSVLVLI